MGLSVVIYTSRMDLSAPPDGGAPHFPKARPAALFDRDMQGPLSLVPDGLGFDDYFPVAVMELPDDAVVVKTVDSWSGNHGSRIRFADGRLMDAGQALRDAVGFAVRVMTLPAPAPVAAPSCTECGERLQACGYRACADCGADVIGCQATGAEGPESIYRLCPSCIPGIPYRRNEFRDILYRRRGIAPLPERKDG